MNPNDNKETIMKKQALVTRESLQQMINNADSVKIQHIVGRALVALFERQTEAEKSDNTTKVNNNVGFAGCDSIGGSLTAKTYMRRKALEAWQVEKWTRIASNGFPRICKYASQLNEIAMEKQQRRLDL
jgi:hypothetical protein